MASPMEDLTTRYGSMPTSKSPGQRNRPYFRSNSQPDLAAAASFTIHDLQRCIHSMIELKGANRKKELECESVLTHIASTLSHHSSTAWDSDTYFECLNTDDEHEFVGRIATYISELRLRESDEERSREDADYRRVYNQFLKAESELKAARIARNFFSSGCTSRSSQSPEKVVPPHWP